VGLCAVVFESCLQIFDGLYVAVNIAVLVSYVLQSVVLLT